MSCNHITMDGGHKVARPITSLEEYMNLRNSPGQVMTLQMVRSGDEKAKFRLVQFNYSGHYPNGVVKGNKLPSKAFGFDVDEPEEAKRVTRLLLNDDGTLTPMGEKLGLQMHEFSARMGSHSVFRREMGKTILENQVRVAQELDCELDTNTHDINRVYFTTSGSPEDLLFVSPELFTDAYNEAEVLAEARVLEDREKRGLEVLPPGAHGGNKHFKPGGGKGSGAALSGPVDVRVINVSASEPLTQAKPAINATAINAHDNEPLTYLGIEYSRIIQKYWELFNDGNEPCEGDRNVKTFELAMSLRSICEYNLDKMLKVIPCYDGLPEEEWRKTIENAVNEPRKGMPWRTRQVLNALKSEKRIEVTGGTRNMPPPMPKRLPPLLRHLTKNVPDYYKPVVAAAVFPPLASHLHGVKFRYWDNTEHEPNLMNVTIGKQSVGKGSIGKPIEYVMADIKLRDAPNRAREAEYKRNNPTNKSKKDPRPTDICIQMVIDNLTDAVFNQRVVDCDNNGQRYVYTRVDEVEALKNVTSKGTVDEVSLLIRKAYDNALHGQERVGPDSVTGIAPLRWNWNASCTPPKARTFFKKAVSDGTVSRLDISTMIVDRKAPDYVPPVFGIYDDQFAEELKPYIDRLNNACGLIECPQATRLAIRMRDGHAKLEELINSDAYGTLSFRANVIAWTKGMVLYIAHGYKWSKEIADFVRWSMDFDMWGKMVFFGDQLEKETAEEDRILSHSGPKNMLDELEDEFTKEDYHHVREMLGKTGDGESTLRVWVKRGYIVWDEVIGKFCKTEAYKSRGFIQD